MELTKKTHLLFTETKRGGSKQKTYEMTAGEFIALVYNKDGDGELNIGMLPIHDEEGDIVDFTENLFDKMPVEEQLNICLRCEGDRYASSITYVVTE